MNYFCLCRTLAIGILVFCLSSQCSMCWYHVFERRNDHQEAWESLSLSGDDITRIFKPPSLPQYSNFRFVHWDILQSLGHLHFICLFYLVPTNFVPLTRLCPPFLTSFPLCTLSIPSTIVGSFKLKITSSRKRFWFKSFITNHLLLARVSFICRRLSPVASFLLVQLNRTSSTKLQKEKKKGRLAKFP